MANRPIFVPSNKSPFTDMFTIEFTWNSGFALSQKRKNIAAIHQTFNQRFPDCKVLEISTKSPQDLGTELSAFYLKKYVPSLSKSIPVECAFQGGKIFTSDSPCTDLYTVATRDAKRDPRLKTGQKLRCFYFEGREIPLTPQTAFYNWLYINALLENPVLAKQLLQFDAFTDIEFNPKKSINCQAEAAAQFVALSRLGLLGQVRDFDAFIQLIR